MRGTGRAVLASIAAVAALGTALWPPPRLDARRLAASVKPHDVRILRDTWGVPHVFGRTDADVAFGLAYAHAEDDFVTIQGVLLAVRGRLASLLGPSGAPNDYMVQLLRIWDVVDARYDSDLDPATRALCEAYAEGLNLYAALHPSKAIPSLYPVVGKDIVAGFVHGTPLLFGLDKTLREILEPGPAKPEREPGSNTFAVAPRRSADGFTRLAINSHQPWQGPQAWYEAHLHSDEGWDMVGGLFPGSPVILHGHNRELGWAHTVNRPDLVDVYVLDINPENPNQYRFDAAWRDLEVRTAAIEVRVFGPLSWTFHREVLWSVYGPALRTPRGTFAIRFAGQGDVRQVEQWYRMNKAHTFEHWLDAMRLMSVPMFNCGYADREGTIAYLYNARLPLRAEGYDWSKPVPGDTSRTLWKESLPFDRLPLVKDPASGFIQSCNSSPFRTTDGPGNPDPRDYSPTFGIETGMTNRALRALELFGQDPAVTRDEFDAYKFDVAYSTASAVAARLRQLLEAPRPEDPLVGEALDLLRGWDLETDPENTRAALAVLTLEPTHDNDSRPVATTELIERLGRAARRLKEHFGRLDVPWKDVNRLRRGAVDLGLGGAPDVLHAVYGASARDGRLVGRAGDSYILLVEWDRQGRVHSRSIHPYGSATRDPASPHFADQAPLFARCQLKPVWLDEAEIRAHLEREYRPGDDARR